MRGAAAATVGAALVCLACPSPPREVVYDLAARAAVADRSSRREVLLLGTPAAEPYLGEGFYRDAGVHGFLWARGESETVWHWPQPSARAVVVDMAPFVGVRGQEVEVRLNGTAVGTAKLADVRQRYLFPLPAGAQKPGENRLRLVFPRVASPADADPKNPDKRQLAAQVYSLTFGPADDPGLLALLGRDAPRPFAVEEAGGVPSLVQLGTSSVRFALRVGKGSELRFTPDLHPGARAAGAEAVFRVTVEDAPGRERQVWSKTIRAADRGAEEVVQRLPAGSEDGIVRIGLHVAGASDDSRAWGLWKAPRVMGRERFDVLGHGPVPAAARAKADALVKDLGPVNVLLVVFDAGRAMQFGCYGYPKPTTPEIDRIAAEGVVFERAYTPAVYTLGAMSSAWTSQYPDRHHSAISFADRLPKDRLTLAELLSGQGFTTAGFVANAVAGSASGFERGFGEFHEVYQRHGSEADSFRHFLPAWFRDPRRPKQRFFAYVHFREPHFPYDPEPPFDTRFGPEGPIAKASRRDQDFFKDANQKRRPFTTEEAAHLVRLYDGNLAFADQELGVIRKDLESLGLWERTVVIVMADHGEGLLEHGWIGHNVDLHEPSIHIPLIVRFPEGKGPRGLRVSGLTDLLDLAPTVADVMGVLGAGGSATRFQGRSLLPALFGAPGKNAVLSRTVWDRPRYALTDERFKLIYDARTGESALYDLKADPGETREVGAERALRLAWARETLREVMGKVGQAEVADAAGGAGITCEQCENLKSMGYLPADTKCPSGC